MDYEKKYNEALERAKTLYENANGMILKKWVEQVFPELADSEEERIRKRLIQYFSTFRLGTFAGLEPKKIIAWLEKQKEFVSADFDDVWETADCNELTAPLEKYSKDAIKEMCHAWYDKGIELERRNWLEKKGGKTPVPKFEVGDVMRTLQEAADNITSGLPVVVSIDDEYYRCNNELIAIKDQDDYEYPPMNRKHGACDSCDEQKPVDKVEPKFKVGDWIIDKSGLVQHVLDFRGGIYSCTYSSFATGCESNYHLWTIKDAKDGDVLVASDGSIFLFAGVVDCACRYYVALTACNDVKINKEVDGGYWETSRAVHPATKEQRDTLFSKMKEAGHVWLSGKKRLVKLLFKEGDTVRKKLDGSIWHINYINEHGYWGNHKPLFPIENQNEFELVEQKPAWSEEDERFVHGLIRGLVAKRDIHGHTTFSSDCIDITETIVWLKSLKDRVQPKQEWSEEDEEYVKDLADYFTGGLSLKHAEEDITNWLKSLRPQNRWKPSGEHYELEEFAKIVRCNLTGISKAVQKLFEAKYLQLTGNKMYEGFKD